MVRGWFVFPSCGLPTVRERAEEVTAIRPQECYETAAVAGAVFGFQQALRRLAVCQGRKVGLPGQGRQARSTPVEKEGVHCGSFRSVWRFGP